MSRLGLFAYIAAIAGITILTATTTMTSIAFVYDYAHGITTLGVVGWLTASMGPIIFSLLICLAARSTLSRWLGHLAFVPLSIAAYRIGSTLYFEESGVLGDSMADGFALLTASGYLVLALLVHLSAIVALVGTALSRRIAGTKSSNA